jgi:hypothetical protein
MNGMKVLFVLSALLTLLGTASATTQIVYYAADDLVELPGTPFWIHLAETYHVDPSLQNPCGSCTTDKPAWQWFTDRTSGSGCGNGFAELRELYACEDAIPQWFKVVTISGNCWTIESCP